MSSKRVSLSDIDGYVRDEIFNAPQPSDVQSAETAALIREAIFENTTSKQQRYLLMYFKKRMSMKEIALACGVSVSTVSRTISLGRNNILKGMKREQLRRIVQRCESEKGGEDAVSSDK